MFIDDLIGYFSPESKYKRISYRNAIELKQRKYDGAGRGGRTTKWRTTGGNANSEVRGAIKPLRDRARDLVRNDAFAAKAVQVVANNIVGKGIMPQLPDGDVADAWKMWTRSTDCDYYGVMNFAAMQRQAMANVFMSGEIFAKKIIDPKAEVPLKIQMLESDFLPIDDQLSKASIPRNNKVVQGVEINPNGLPIAYHMYKQHPGSTGEEADNGFGEIVRVMRKDLAHIYRQDRPGQLRGISWFHPVLIMLKDFAELQDAQLLKQKVSALFAGFIKDLDADIVEGEEQEDLELTPGALQKLPTGMDITFSNPPSTEFYAEYATNVLHSIASGLGLTYESLTGDLSKVNFSSARMGWLEMNRNLDCWRDQVINTQFNDKIFGWFLESLKLKGKNVPDINLRPSWTSPKREMIDPTKEIPAKIKAIRAGLVTFSDAIRETGKHPDDHIKELQADKIKIDAANLILDSDAEKKALNGQNVIEEDDNENSQGNDNG